MPEQGDCTPQPGVDLARRQSASGQWVWLAGNPSEGFTAHGPYQDFEALCEAHDFEDGWAMQLTKPSARSGSAHASDRTRRHVNR
jgi:hypothetical protein